MKWIETRCDSWLALNAVTCEERHINEKRTKSVKTTILMCPLHSGVLNATPGNEEDGRCEERAQDGTSKRLGYLADYVTVLLLPERLIIIHLVPFSLRNVPLYCNIITEHEDKCT